MENIIKLKKIYNIDRKGFFYGLKKNVDMLWYISVDRIYMSYNILIV